MSKAEVLDADDFARFHDPLRRPRIAVKVVAARPPLGPDKRRHVPPVPSVWRLDMKTVIVPVDDTELSERALPVAGAIAAAAQSDLVLITLDSARVEPGPIRANLEALHHRVPAGVHVSDVVALDDDETVEQMIVREAFGRPSSAVVMATHLEAMRIARSWSSAPTSPAPEGQGGLAPAQRVDHARPMPSAARYQAGCAMAPRQ